MGVTGFLRDPIVTVGGKHTEVELRKELLSRVQSDNLVFLYHEDHPGLLGAGLVWHWNLENSGLLQT